jgi:hypothetical protein
MDSTGLVEKNVISDQMIISDMQPVTTAIVFRKYCRRKHSHHHSGTIEDINDM